MATCGNKPASPMQRHTSSCTPDSTCWPGSGRVSMEGNWAWERKGTLSIQLHTWCFRTGTTQAHPRPAGSSKPTLGCSSTSYLPPNTGQNVLSAQGPVTGPGPLARIPVWGKRQCVTRAAETSPATGQHLLPFSYRGLYPSAPHKDRHSSAVTGMTGDKRGPSPAQRRCRPESSPPELQ